MDNTPNTLNEQQVRKIVADMIQRDAYDAQFRVGPIAYHAHTGVDSAPVDGANLVGPLLARIQIVNATATPAPPTTDNDLFEITAATGTVAFQPPFGNIVNGQLLRIRITSSNSATARSLTWSTATGGYLGNSPALPSATTTGKTSTLGFEYDASNSVNKWRLLWSANS